MDNQFSTFDSSQNHYLGIHHSTARGATGSVPVHIGTGTLVTRDEDLSRGTMPMPTFARKGLVDHKFIMSGGHSADICAWTAKTTDIGTTIR